MCVLNWRHALGFGVVVLIVLVLGLGILYLVFGGPWAAQGGPMMGPGRMRGGWCPWCGVRGASGGGILAAILGFAAVCLLPLGLLALLIMGGIWLGRSAGAGGPAASQLSSACPNCGTTVQQGWRTCPHCGEDLTDE